MGNAKNLAFWAVVILLLVALFSVFQEGGSNRQGARITFSEFLERVDSNQVSNVVIDGERITGRLASGGEFQTIQPRNADILEDLRAAGVEIRVEPQGLVEQFVDLLRLAGAGDDDLPGLQIEAVGRR